MQAIRCAHADLVGALQAHQQMDRMAHDWKAHQDSIIELEQAFPGVISMQDRLRTEDEE